MNPNYLYFEGWNLFWRIRNRVVFILVISRGLRPLLVQFSGWYGWKEEKEKNCVHGWLIFDVFCLYSWEAGEQDMDLSEVEMTRQKYSFGFLMSCLVRLRSRGYMNPILGWKEQKLIQPFFSLISYRYSIRNFI